MTGYLRCIRVFLFILTPFYFYAEDEVVNPCPECPEPCCLECGDAVYGDAGDDDKDLSYFPDVYLDSCW